MARPIPREAPVIMAVLPARQRVADMPCVSFDVNKGRVEIYVAAIIGYA